MADVAIQHADTGNEHISRKNMTLSNHNIWKILMQREGRSKNVCHNEGIKAAGLNTTHHSKHQHKIFHEWCRLPLTSPLRSISSQTAVHGPVRIMSYLSAPLVWEIKVKMKLSVCTSWERRWPFMNLGTIGG
jgi:hypothetical protein